MKHRIKIKRISYRLAFMYACIFSIALLSVNTATYISVSIYINQTAAKQIEMINAAIRSELRTKNDLDEIDLESISQTAENIGSRILVNDVTVYNTFEEFNQVLPEVTTGTAKYLTEDAMKIIYLNEVIRIDGVGTVQIQNMKAMDNEQAYLHMLLNIMAIVDFFILILSIGLGIFISKKALKPIDQITKQAKMIHVNNLSGRINIAGPEDELKRLADTFNEMLENIQYSYERQNQFTLDASHELATPLAVIKGYIELIDSWGKEQPDVLEEGIQSIKRESRNMSGLLDTLLYLSQNETDQITLDYQTFILQDLISEVVTETRMLTQIHSIEQITSSDISLRADRNLIKQMLRALIDNCIKYTPAKGTISLGYTYTKTQIIINVQDTGIGIPEDELPHIFDRFFRVDKARSRSEGGFGLGLSIVQLIVRSHNGTITASSQINSGTVMTVRLPRL